MTVLIAWAILIVGTIYVLKVGLKIFVSMMDLWKQHIDLEVLQRKGK